MGVIACPRYRSTEGGVLQITSQGFAYALLHKAEWGPYKVVAFKTAVAVDAALKALEDNPLELEPDEEMRTWLDMVNDIKKEGYLRVGVAKAVITPPIPCLRWEGKELTGVYRDLYARVVVLSREDTQVALVLCDLLGLLVGLVGKIRQKLEEKFGFPAENVQLACTHAHSTPDTIGLGYENQDYLESMVDTIVDAIGEAAANNQPARMGWGRVPIRGLACSRRIKMTNGKVYTTRYGVPSTWRVDPELIADKGHIDPDLTVVRIESLDGEVLAAISNFACHNSVAYMSPNISGDYAGEAMAILEDVYGDQSVVLCTNGAAGDVDPTEEMPIWGPRQDFMALHLGRIFAAQVMEALERVEVGDKAVVGASRELLDLEVRSDWVRLIEQEQDRMRVEMAKGWQLSSEMARTLRDKVIHTEVHALRLDGLILVGMPGEIFTDIALELKSKVPNRAVAVVELANGSVGYVPTLEAISQGGYEIGQHLWNRAKPGAAGMMLEAAEKLVDRLMADNT